MGNWQFDVIATKAVVACAESYYLLPIRKLNMEMLVIYREIFLAKKTNYSAFMTTARQRQDAFPTLCPPDAP